MEVAPQKSVKNVSQMGQNPFPLPPASKSNKTLYPDLPFGVGALSFMSGVFLRAQGRFVRFLGEGGHGVKLLMKTYIM